MSEKDSNLENDDVSKYYCKTCDYHCKYPAHWKQHCDSKKHKNGGQREKRDKTFTGKCSECNFITTQTTNLQLHYLNHHANKEARKKGFKYYCESCDYGSFVRRLYQIHLDTKHN